MLHRLGSGNIYFRAMDNLAKRFFFVGGGRSAFKINPNRSHPRLITNNRVTFYCARLKYI